MRAITWGLLFAAGVASADPIAATTDADADADAGPSWPRAAIDRPLTMPSGLLVAGGDVIGARTEMASTAWAGDLALGVGITDKLEANLLTPNYTFPLDTFQPSGALDAGAGYALVRGAIDGKLEVIARAAGGFDLATSQARPLRVGLQAQLNVTPWLAVVSHDLGAGNAGVAIALSGAHRVDAVAPIGLGVQLARTLWVEADTAAPLAARAVPVSATALINLLDGQVDALGYIGVNDVADARDSIWFGVGVRYYASLTRR